MKILQHRIHFLCKKKNPTQLRTSKYSRFCTLDKGRMQSWCTGIYLRIQYKFTSKIQHNNLVRMFNLKLHFWPSIT
jgi:hypothetical protein